MSPTTRPAPAESSLAYINRLMQLGFGENHFRGNNTPARPSLHHFGYRETFASHRRYVEGRAAVNGTIRGNNITVRDRLGYLTERATDHLNGMGESADDAGQLPSIADSDWRKWILEVVHLFPVGLKSEAVTKKSKTALKRNAATQSAPCAIAPAATDTAAFAAHHDDYPAAAPGLYLAMPISAELRPITLDVRYTASCARVNNTHVKFGRAANLRARYAGGYAKDFPDNIRFCPLLILNDPEDVVRAESAVKARLRDYRMRSPKNRRLEWMSGISPEAAADTVFSTLDSEGIDYTRLVPAQA